MIDIPDTLPIIGSPQFGFEHCNYALQVYAPHLSANQRLDIAAACTTYGVLANISDLAILCHCAKECTWFKSDRWVKSFNPSGLGATNDGAWGAVFRNAAEGIAATVAHQLLYALKPESMTFPQKILSELDPRREPLRKAHGFGCAPRWIDLSQKWGVLPKGAPIPPITDPSAYGMSIIVRLRQAAALVPPKGRL